ncbi:MAG: glutamate--tRNA ligase [Candidatus Margulisbacteria bacterium]|nr:glutamate--tRNA ligase [Candidatus Margulisiibacteriota bacterium]
MMNMRVRFAPSPTGNLHIGTLRTALFNWFLVRHNNGACILRMEDTDAERSQPEFEKNITDALKWLGLSMDESPDLGGEYGPYRQSERVHLYKAASQQLIDKGDAYPCFCTTEDLGKEREEAIRKGEPYVYSRKCLALSQSEIDEKKKRGVAHTIRFKMPDHTLHFTDIIRGDISFDLALNADFVIIKSDGSASYNFAVVVDDHEMAITHVIRGEDHISNTPRQLALFEALSYTPPKFAHLPMILAPDRTKLSKRFGATSVLDYHEKGYLPQTIINYLALLGWSPPDDTEVMSLSDIVRLFSLDRVSKSGAIFDVEKLKWMNGQHIRLLDQNALFEAVTPFMTSETQASLSRYSENEMKEIIMSVKDNLDVLLDINQYLEMYGLSKEGYQEKMHQVDFNWKEEEKQVIGLFLEAIAKADEHFSPESMGHILEEIAQNVGLKKGKLFKPIRLACTGYTSGPQLLTCLSILGKKVLLERLQFLLENREK